MLTTRADGLVIPEEGFLPAPAIPQPNIFLIEWRVERQKLVEIYEAAKVHQWSPSDLPWDSRTSSRSSDWGVREQGSVRPEAV